MYKLLLVLFNFLLYYFDLLICFVTICSLLLYYFFVGTLNYSAMSGKYFDTSVGFNVVYK